MVALGTVVESPLREAVVELVETVCGRGLATNGPADRQRPMRFLTPI